MVGTDFPELSTERLRLRLPAPDSAQAVADYYRRNADHFERWDPPRPDGFHTPSFWKDRLASNRREFRDGRSVRWFLFPKDSDPTIVGHCSFTNISRGPFQACLLGYGLDQELQGRGLMGEALRTAIRYAFDELKLHRIMANYLPENERSARVLERLGFEVEGLAQSYLFVGGRWRDHVLTALTNDDAPDPKPCG